MKKATIVFNIETEAKSHTIMELILNIHLKNGQSLLLFLQSLVMSNNKLKSIRGKFYETCSLMRGKLNMIYKL